MIDSVPGLNISLDERGVLHLVLDRPERRNAINDTMMQGLIGALECAATDESVRVILLEGAGDHFCGGADIVARNAPTDAPKPRAGSIQRRLPLQAHRLIPLTLSVQVPIVCRVRGWAAGIGFQLAMAADITFAENDAEFWEPFAQRAFTPDSAATWLLPRRVGEVRARELLLFGRILSGKEAASWGAIHKACAPRGLDSEVNEAVDYFARGATVALGLTKWLLTESAGASLEAQLANEAFAMELSSRSSDFREGLAAFQEKRPPNFDGR